MSLFSIRGFWTLIAISTIIIHPLPAVQYFEVIEQRIVGEHTFYLDRIVKGVELVNESRHRLDMVSENQNHYPIPESGCGPTAMLSILLWYEDYGLIRSFSRDADDLRQYKLNLFREIDHRLMRQARAMRNANNGTSLRQMAVVMDFMFKVRLKGTARIQTDFINEPLKQRDFLETMKNFRSGILSVRGKDPETGELQGLHAAVVMHADEEGLITLGTWGKRYLGSLENRSDGQWFIPQDPNHLELKVELLARFTPFQPEAH